MTTPLEELLKEEKKNWQLGLDLDRFAKVILKRIKDEGIEPFTLSFDFNKRNVSMYIDYYDYHHDYRSCSALLRFCYNDSQDLTDKDKLEVMRYLVGEDV